LEGPRLCRSGYDGPPVLQTSGTGTGNSVGGIYDGAGTDGKCKVESGVTKNIGVSEDSKSNASGDNDYVHS